MEYKYAVLDVARYIIEEAKSRNQHISNLKLQKLLYYVESFYITESGMESALFVEDFEAWDYGPVIPVVYREFKYNGRSSIVDTRVKQVKYNESNYSLSFEEIPFDKNVIEKEDQKFINDILNIYGKHEAYELVKLTHQQDPWINAYREKSTITKDKIYKYFKKYLRENNGD